MKLTNKFTLAVPTERVWETLLDIERVASFLPGAKIAPAARTASSTERCASNSGR